jgi:hypothetical protein
MQIPTCFTNHRKITRLLPWISRRCSDIAPNPLLFLLREVEKDETVKILCEEKNRKEYVHGMPTAKSWSWTCNILFAVVHGNLPS